MTVARRLERGREATKEPLQAIPWRQGSVVFEASPAARIPDETTRGRKDFSLGWRRGKPFPDRACGVWDPPFSVGGEAQELTGS